MKNVNPLITLFLSLTLTFYIQKADCAFHVIIDPGHGGNDLGAHQSSFIESKIVLQIAEKIKKNIESSTHFKDDKITLTREKESLFLSLENRVDIANEAQADLFISLHANWSTSSKVSGIEFYFPTDEYMLSQHHRVSHRNPQNVNSDDLRISSQLKSANPILFIPEKKDSLLSSQDIIKKITSDLHLLSKKKRSLEFSKKTQELSKDKKSVIRRAPFYVIENTNMPAVLVEVGFISNRREAKKLSSPEYQTEIASILTQSILEFKEKSDKKDRVIEK